MLLKKLVPCGAIALVLTGCGTSPQIAAKTPKLTGLVRAVEGTGMIGVKGATPEDQERIDEHNAGLCGAKVWTPSECARLN
jgi:uncharacterized lipoprotein YajG